jgi:hypothetical protein
MKLSETLKSVLGTVAPTLAHALGGPIAGAAVATLSEKLLGRPTGTPDEIDTALKNATPEVLLKVREAEIEFKKFLTDAEIRLEGLANEDRASARAREIVVRDHMPAVIALLVIVSFVGTLAWVMHWGLAVSAEDVVMIMIGALGAKFGSVVDYFVGSSAGSKNKSDTIDAMVGKGK